LQYRVYLDQPGPTVCFTKIIWSTFYSRMKWDFKVCHHRDRNQQSSFHLWFPRPRRRNWRRPTWSSKPHRKHIRELCSHWITEVELLYITKAHEAYKFLFTIS
jgi:hypothetical protein